MRNARFGGLQPHVLWWHGVTFKRKRGSNSVPARPARCCMVARCYSGSTCRKRCSKRRDSLLIAYDEATTAYSHSLNQLKAQTPVLPKEQYERLRTSTEVARIRSETCRLQLDQHIADHGC